IMRLLISGAIYAAAFACAVGASPLFPHGRAVVYPADVPVVANSFIVEFHDNATPRHVRMVRRTPNLSVDHHFSGPFNGMVVTARGPAAPAQLAAIAGVKRVFPNRIRTLSYLPGTQNVTSTYLHEVTGVQRALKELGLDGTGVKIGIIDTGVDYMHPELGACWMTPGCPWQYGQDLVGDSFDYYAPDPIIIPNATPLDCVGHGTHVAGILAARGPLVQGVAPGATFGMYRVFSCPDSRGNMPTTDAIVVQAMEAAYKDGHHIITMSLGGGGWSESPMSAYAAGLAAKGIVVVAGDGNQGMEGLLTTGSPAVGDGVLGVGSVDNWSFSGAGIILSSAQGTFDVPTQQSFQFDMPFAFAGDVPIVTVADSTGSPSACHSIGTSLAGSIALVPRGNCSFTDKVTNAQQAGAVGVLFYNTAGLPMAGVALQKNALIPVAIVTYEDGMRIANATSQGPVVVRTPGNYYTTSPTSLGGKMSVFSSFGPTPELGLSPAVSAPGGNILSTYPLTKGSYMSLSGTSMATPYLAGTAALLKQARPGLSGADIGKLLITSAKPRVDEATGLHTSPYQSGGGLVNVYDAIKSRALANPPLLPINNTQSTLGWCPLAPWLPGGTRWTMRTVTITNTDTQRGLRVSLSHEPGVSRTMFDPNGAYSSAVMAGKPMRSWPTSRDPVPNNTLPQVVPVFGDQYIWPGTSAPFTVVIIAPYGLPEIEHWFYGGFLAFALQWDGEAATSKLTVPYAGYNGDYRKLDVIGAAPLSPPLLLGSDRQPIADVGGLTITAQTNATLAVTLTLPTRVLVATLVGADGKTAGYIGGGYSEYNGRSQSIKPRIEMLVSTTVFLDKALTARVSVPPGAYHLRVDALRPFGDPDKAADYQSWESGAFTLA
ncbi:hypothetical protein H4R19_004451, partial [Coemansia spiralis]